MYEGIADLTPQNLTDIAAHWYRGRWPAPVGSKWDQRAWTEFDASSVRAEPSWIRMFQFLKRTKVIEKPIVVQIDFNKSATKSLTFLFANSGDPSLHCNFQFLNGKRTKMDGIPAQRRIHRNINAGRPAFEGFEDVDAFFDLEMHRPTFRLENFRAFRKIHAHYPNSRFILNWRDKDAWIESRRKYRDGVYIGKFMKIYNENESEIISRWSKEYDVHYAEVREYFKKMPDKLIDFQIDQTPISAIIAFVKPDFHLDPDRWGHYHKSSRHPNG